ncbi:MAG: sugar ABC transporter substrate-binding protein [Gammaproteobacteria bacterium]|nr:MAG: sugar ABC transporter substrate-binding protein [Gammaproteobacteria bacterium]
MKINILLFSTIFAIISCASPNIPTDVLDTNQHSIVTDEYRIGVDDVVQVHVWGNEQLSVSVPVRPDGKISMPLLGDVAVAGKTAEEVSTDITQQLKSDIRDPNVTVTMVSLDSKEYLRRVRVTGAVLEPISLDYRQGMTVIDAVLEAGGLGEFAAGNRAILIRKNEGKTVSVPLRLEDMLVRGEINSNHILLPGDIITVPERRF